MHLFPMRYVFHHSKVNKLAISLTGIASFIMVRTLSIQILLLILWYEIRRQGHNTE